MNKRHDGQLYELIYTGLVVDIANGCENKVEQESQKPLEVIYLEATSTNSVQYALGFSPHHQDIRSTLPSLAFLDIKCLLCRCLKNLDLQTRSSPGGSFTFSGSGKECENVELGSN